jgi:hypothetical protein
MRPFKTDDSPVCCRELKPGTDRKDHTLEDHVSYKDKVFIPGPGRIFVFGSNRAGIHGAGAAMTAHKLYGALWGLGEGFAGNSYALPTKDEHIETLPLDAVAEHVARFIEVATCRPDLYFFVTRIGCGLAGFTDEQITPLFRDAPMNCELPEGWR